MNGRKFDSTTEIFLANISLTNTQANRLDAKVAELYGFFYSMLGDDTKIYMQGSYATGTVVKPLTMNQDGGPGDYDFDLVIERTDWTGAKSALEEIETLLYEDPDYKDALAKEQKPSCIRLEFGEDAHTKAAFHVDVVPILNQSGVKKVARRDSDKWEDSDSRALIDWTNSFFENHRFARATLLIFKRVRDVGGFTIEVPSIIILSLLNSFYKDQGSYLEDFKKFIEAINEEFSKGLDGFDITNPINPDESLLKKWKKNPSDFQAIQKYFVAVFNSLQNCMETEDTFEFQEIFSNDFPSGFFEENVHSIRKRGFNIDLSGKLSHDYLISAKAPDGKPGPTDHEIYFFERSKKIWFTAEKFTDESTIYWQVNNSNGDWPKRGEFFKAKAEGGESGSSPSEAINYENEQYLGRHWIRYIAVENNTAIVISKPFYIRVFKDNSSKAPILPANRR